MSLSFRATIAPSNRYRWLPGRIWLIRSAKVLITSPSKLLAWSNWLEVDHRRCLSVLSTRTCHQDSTLWTGRGRIARGGYQSQALAFKVSKMTCLQIPCSKLPQSAQELPSLPMMTKMSRPSTRGIMMGQRLLKSSSSIKASPIKTSNNWSNRWRCSLSTVKCSIRQLRTHAPTSFNKLIIALRPRMDSWAVSGNKQRQGMR